MKKGAKIKYFYKPTNEYRIGYVKYFGNTKKGAAKFAFVGTNKAGKITTFCIQSGNSFWRMINDTISKIINPIK